MDDVVEGRKSTVESVEEHGGDCVEKAKLLSRQPVTGARKEPNITNRTCMALYGYSLQLDKMLGNL